MNAPQPPDDFMDDDDRDLRALYGKLPAAEPGPALDARIRAQAHAAARADQRGRNRQRRLHPGWAIAASVVLASGLLLLTDLSRQAEAPSQATAPRVDAELARPPQLQDMAPVPAPAPPPELRMQRKADAPPSPAPDAASSMPRPGAGIAPETVAPPWRLTPPSLAPAPHGGHAPRADSAAPATPAQPAAPAPPATPAQPAAPATAARPASPVRAAPVRPPASLAEPAPATSADAPAAAESNANREQAPAATESNTARQQTAAVGGSVAGHEDGARQERARQADAQAERKTSRSLAPRKVAGTAEQQVERVRAMLKAGKPDEAVQALQALRQAWPQYDIPQDLRRLLPESEPAR
ncbi:hypothetical protein [Bordetella genomosp. 13]|uniref:hypothetical protein n=1 Tax=Bordetella genomosp. 13 TaxID=463040 RepID=UPI0011A336B2|nr:hypothetical protein [Bordetella genomosp. 13]